MVWLARHGEVHNPSRVVYGKLPGFGLSDEGKRQAARLADHLAGAGVGMVFTSPLLRARQTAQIITTRCRLAVPMVLEDLTEWELGAYWSGRTWDWIAKNRAEEWRTYMERPSQLRVVRESLSILAERMLGALVAALEESSRRGSDSPICLVSHADPIKALALSLLGQDLDRLHSLELPVGTALCLAVEMKAGSPSNAEMLARGPLPASQGHTSPAG